MTERSMTEGATPQLSAVLTVTIETASRAYFDRNDLVQNATHWIESAFEDRDGISNVTITEAGQDQPVGRPELGDPEDRQARYARAVKRYAADYAYEIADAAMAVADEEITEALRISDAATNAMLKTRDEEIVRLRAELAKVTR